MTFEAYRVAVKLSLINNVSAGLMTMSRHLVGTGKDVDALQVKLKSLQKLGLVGGAMAGVGFGVLAMFKGPLEEAKKFQTEAAKFASLGFGGIVNSEAVKFARGMQTIGTSARDNMSIVGDAMAVFKDLNEAKMVAPLMAKMKFANEVLFGADGGERDKKLMDMMKVAEFRGGTKSPAEFARQANFAQQAIAGSRNRVDPTALLQAQKTGGVALSRRSNEAFYLGAEPLVQEFGGSRYGTAAMSIYQNLVQSRGTITAQQELYRLGLLNKSMVQFNNLGMLKKALPGAFTGASVLENEGELALLEKVLLPAFAKKGITSEEGVLRELGMILGNRTGSSLMSRIYQQREKLHMQTDANYHAENLDQASERAAGTLAGKEVAMHKKWATLMSELGITILPIAIKAVEGLTSVIKGAVSFAREFPTLTKGLTIAVGVLAGMVAAGGVVTLATAGFKALKVAMAFSGGVTGLATAFTGLGGALNTAGTGVSAINGVTDIATLGSRLGVLAIGLGALAAAVGGMAWILDKIGTGDTDPLNHPGMRFHRHGRGAGNGEWKTDLSLPQDHAYQHWKSLGRAGGYWENEDGTSTLPVGDVKRLPVPVPLGVRIPQSAGAWPSNDEHAGQNFVRSGRGGYWVPNSGGTGIQSVAPARDQSRPVTINNKIVMPNGRVLAEVVTTEQAREMSRPFSGSSSFDGSMHLAPVAHGGR